MPDVDESDDRKPAQRWELDRRVPVALILALLGQFAGGVWWVSSIHHDVADQGRRIDRLELESTSSANLRQEVRDRLIAIEITLKLLFKPQQVER